jgi:coproporphyrinogen III oxidase-like Fe-S oxidoreductase
VGGAVCVRVSEWIRECEDWFTRLLELSVECNILYLESQQLLGCCCGSTGRLLLHRVAASARLMDWQERRGVDNKHQENDGQQ